MSLPKNAFIFIFEGHFQSVAFIFFQHFRNTISLFSGLVAPPKVTCFLWLLLILLSLSLFSSVLCCYTKVWFSLCLSYLDSRAFQVFPGWLCEVLKYLSYYLFIYCFCPFCVFPLLVTISILSSIFLSIQIIVISIIIILLLLLLLL